MRTVCEYLFNYKDAEAFNNVMQSRGEFFLTNLKEKWDDRIDYLVDQDEIYDESENELTGDQMWDFIHDYWDFDAETTEKLINDIFQIS